MEERREEKRGEEKSRRALILDQRDEVLENKIENQK